MELQPVPVADSLAVFRHALMEMGHISVVAQLPFPLT